MGKRFSDFAVFFTSLCAVCAFHCGDSFHHCFSAFLLIFTISSHKPSRIKKHASFPIKLCPINNNHTTPRKRICVILFLKFKNVFHFAIENTAQIVKRHCAYRFVMLETVKQASAHPILIYQFVCGAILFFERSVKRIV